MSLERKIPIDVEYVPYSRLLCKLEIIEIEGLLLRWIEAFLTNRSSTVKVGSSYSTKLKVLSGVPQRSVLGPNLFLLYRVPHPSLDIGN